MTLSGPLHAGVIGLRRGLDGMREHARTIARETLPESDRPTPSGLTGALVGLNEDRHLTEAAAKVVRSADDALGHLLDIRA